MEMAEREINEAVARKMGWTYEKPPEVSYCATMPWIDSTGKPHFSFPDYCHSIEAAWEIVQEMLPGLGIWNERGVWVVSRLDFSGLGETLAEADTAPMAICLAYLQLSETGVESHV